jgi:hypothetical protein
MHGKGSGRKQGRDRMETQSNDRLLCVYRIVSNTDIWSDFSCSIEIETPLRKAPVLARVVAVLELCVLKDEVPVVS